MKKPKVRNIFLISAGSLLIAAALILTGYNLWDDYRASNAAAEVLHSMEELGVGQTQPSGGQEVPEYVWNPYMDMPAVTIDGYRYIGTGGGASGHGGMGLYPYEDCALSVFRFGLSEQSGDLCAQLPFAVWPAG